MKAKFSKKKLISIILIIAIVFVGGILAVKNTNNNSDEKPLVEAYVTKALFGSTVKVQLTEDGINKYPNVDRYEIYYKETLASPVAKLKEETTVFPARKAGDKVEVHLLDKDENKVDVIEVKLVTE